MAERGARLTLVDLEKTYGTFTALRRTNLQIEPGEFFSLIGPSGSGKTTLLGAVAGFSPASRGRIEIDGTDISSMPPFMRNIGMVFQNYALFPHMSVFENVAFPLKLRKLPAAEVKQRTQAMLATVRLPDVGHRMPSQLSGGQQQRIALARAAVYSPRMLLMDEPLGALDKNLREEMQFEIKAFHRKVDATVLYVTHDQDEAAAMSDRLAIMNGGEIVQHGTPRDLYEHPRNAFVACFLGSANLIDVTAKPQASGGQSLHVPIKGGALKALDTMSGTATAANSVVCIRPESIRIETGTPAVSEDDNTLEGRILDAVYTAGMFRYQVETDQGAVMTVRLPSVRQSDMLPMSARVSLIWPAAATLLINKE
ncbi:putative spermidine/putrescine transport system ATP-binding protein [Rhodoligotrophos appendicifer]|uniref:ABC transporter ATP-binding protein n=1 Tax=Rhodoligotrophos appendicifer TaxID=987056 RepID=UPI0011805111|nr:ABC transporter ATP-binding protein [Rhodoligotrophos appendicifer]